MTPARPCRLCGAIESCCTTSLERQQDIEALTVYAKKLEDQLADMRIKAAEYASHARQQ